MSFKKFITAAIGIIKPPVDTYLGAIRIINGWCMVTNSRMSYTVYEPNLQHIDATVSAKKFLAAVKACAFQPEVVKQTDKNLIIRRGKFSAKIGRLLNDAYPVFAVGSTTTSIDINDISTLRALRHFVSTDTSRPWACAIYCDGTRAWATNNVILASVPFYMPVSFVLPIYAYDELVKGNTDVISLAVGANGARFDLKDGIQLHTSLMNLDWPSISHILKPTTAPPVPETMLDGVKSLLPLCEDTSFPRIILSPEGMSTEDGVTQASLTGMSFHHAMFHAKPLLEVLEVATHLDLATYPNPCYFKGTDGLEGVLVGTK